VEWAFRRLAAAAVILDGEGRVLLVRHTYGRLNWEIPGGASDPGESVVETAVREVREEVGVQAVADRLTGIYYDAERDAHHFVFRCHITDKAVPAPSSAEISGCSYWPLDGLPRPISDFTTRRIRDSFGPLPELPPVVVPPPSWFE
jgi:8-oxo-dGTP diphosphatase